jgi:hypothetical protein
MASFDKQIRDLFASEQHRLTSLAAKRNHTLAAGKPTEPKKEALAPTNLLVGRRKVK